MILGLDISTSKIGYCILDSKKKIIANEFMKLKPLQLEDRAEIFYEFLSIISKKSFSGIVYRRFNESTLNKDESSIELI